MSIMSVARKFYEGNSFVLRIVHNGVEWALCVCVAELKRNRDGAVEKK